MEMEDKLEGISENTKGLSDTDVKNGTQEQVSSQRNIQDIDQAQNVNATPMQFNTQNFNVKTEFNVRDYCGKITGVTYIEESNKILPNVKVLLYFGTINEIAVYKTKSDENGNFSIEDLPPGYYSILAYAGHDLKDAVQCIKVLPGQSIHQCILLR
ncbi:carboxypeptidase-like regulatory domain-containing protein [Wukongibacter baidiensis]|uniref:carboxypeptidase-like regulatory domain-containing protein n=1 Tax=Wukongibacter baidiensis TaxID=1723361 RepID=UPI003D7F91BA